MAIEQSPEQRKATIEKRVKVGAAIVVGLLVAPVIFTAIGGLIGLGIAAAVGFTGMQLAPVFAMKVANWRMKLITSEASKNPIETMKNVYIEKAQAIQEADRRIVEFEGKIGDYHDKMVNFAKKYPEEAPRYQEIEQKMRQGLASMKRKQGAAKQALIELKANIEKAESIYSMALAAADVTQLSQDVEKQVFQDIKQQVAFDSVTHKLNTAVASLSLEVENQEEYKALPTTKTDLAKEFMVSGRETLTSKSNEEEKETNG